MAPQANALVLPSEVPADVFFAFWIPVVEATGGEEARIILGQGIAVDVVLIGAHDTETTDAFALAGWIRSPRDSSSFCGSATPCSTRISAASSTAI